MKLKWVDRVFDFIDRLTWPAIVFAVLYFGWQVVR